MSSEILAISPLRETVSLSFDSDVHDPKNLKDNTHNRIKDLRDISFNALSSVDTEFSYWYTRKWDEIVDDEPLIRRAKALKYAFSHLTPNIFPGEKIVMQRTAYYRGSFPMPWLSESSLFTDLTDTVDVEHHCVEKQIHSGSAVMDSAEHIVPLAGNFKIRTEKVSELTSLARAWARRSVEALGYKCEKQLPDYQLKEDIMMSVISMFDSGYALPEEREVINYYYPLQYGLDGIKNISMSQSDRVEGLAARILIEGLQNWIHNYEQHARDLAQLTKNAVQQKEYTDIADCLAWIAHHQPRTFREAMQLTYTLHLAMINEDSHSEVSSGRLGQILWPWFEQDIEAGRLTEEEALELLQLNRIKLSCVERFALTEEAGSALSGIAFNNIALGGLHKNGSPATNRLEELMIEAGIRCNTSQPTLTILHDENLPESFMLKALECFNTEANSLAWVDNEAGIQFLMNQYASEGMSIEEARAIEIDGCFEASAGYFFPLILNGRKYDIPGGSRGATASGAYFLETPKILKLVLTNGMDTHSGIQIYPPHNLPLKSFEQFWEQFTRYYELTCDVLVKASHIQTDVRRKNKMSIINSFLKPDATKNGIKNVHAGNRYNANKNIESCGTLATIKLLAAIKREVYDENNYTLDELTEALFNHANASNVELRGQISTAEQQKSKLKKRYNDAIRAACFNIPGFGDNDPCLDEILRNYEQWFCSLSKQFAILHEESIPTDSENEKNRQHIIFSTTTVFEYRQAHNAKRELKTNSVPEAGTPDFQKMLEHILSNLRKCKFHIHHNTVSSETLRNAQRQPENYRQLILRVGRFTQHWSEISKSLQDEIISRIEYEEMSI